MTESGYPAKRTARKPKIIQVVADNQGYLIGVVYDNGRVFLWNYSTFPSRSLQDAGEGYWSEPDRSNGRVANLPAFHHEKRIST
jgi:hypothetical protein